MPCEKRLIYFASGSHSIFPDVFRDISAFGVFISESVMGVVMPQGFRTNSKYNKHCETLNIICGFCGSNVTC